MDPRHPLRHVLCAHGTMAWREAGQGPAMVLLHGIGSGSASWTGQLDAWAATHRVIAWDAPGYGESAPLAANTPMAGDYAAALADLLARLGVEPRVVVGHSLGALMAAAWAATQGRELRALVLASPARGYGAADPDVRRAKWQERVRAIEESGAEGLAAARAASLCAPGAAPEVIETVRANMAKATRRGYGQAAYMLAHDDLRRHLQSVHVPVAVLCGELDRVTPPEACAAVARDIGAPFTLLSEVAHACYVENPAGFSAAVMRVLEPEPTAQA